MQVLYATSNNLKFQKAQIVCHRQGIQLQQQELDVHEIQGEDGTVIARDKAEKAFAKLKKPAVISDDSWHIPGLNGFPGAYMKSMNHWLTPQDWLNLTRQLQDRRIILRQVVVYQDADQQKVFVQDAEGILLTEARGLSPFPHAYITSFDSGKHSNAELHEQGLPTTAHIRGSWDDFAEWYSKHHA
jgi:non-canonical purine NTP pyrophosphatase (RdgB/HAM1 family)